MKTHRRLPLVSLALLVLALLATPQLRAQGDDGSEPDFASNQALLSVKLDQSGPAKVDLWLPVGVKDREPLRRTIAQTFSFPLWFDEATEEEDFWEYWANVRAANVSWTLISGEGARSFSDAGMKSNCSINLQPLIETLKLHNIEHLKIAVAVESATYNVTAAPPLASIGPADLHYYHADLDVRAPAFYSLSVSTGYGAGDVLKRAAPLIAFLLLPWLLTLVMSRSARRFADRPAELWARHLRFLHRLLSAIWLIWIPIYFFSGVFDVVALVFGRYHRALVEFINVAFYFGPPIVAMWLCHLASRSVYRYVTGVPWSAGEVVRRAILGNVIALTPMFLLILIINALGSSLQQAALYAVVGYAGWLLLYQSGRGFAPKLHALTSGDLRDRIFELAQRAEVGLKQIYVLPEERAQLSNAFARGDDSVMITNSLLKHLSRREVDAIMAHEVGHLKARHPQRRNTITVLVIVVVNVLGLAFATILRLSNVIPFVICLALAVANLILFFVSRRNERQADTIGISLTGDPEAFISGLAKLSRLNLMPLHSGGWSESLETHPSTMRRFAAIAKAHAIPDDRLQMLVAETATTRETSYPMIEEDEVEAQIFSSEFKKKYRMRLALSLLGGLLLPPLPFAVVLAWTNPSGIWLLSMAIIGFLCSFGIYQVVRNLTVFGGHAQLARRMRMKLERTGLADVARQGILVGLAPADHARKYEEYSFWDVGVLWLTNNKLYYLGEHTRFALERSQVSDIYVKNSVPEWLPEKSLYLEWQKTSQAAKQKLHFLAVGESSMLRSRRAIESLKNRLDRWRFQREEFPPVTPGLESIAAPAFPEITSAPAIISFNVARVLRVAVQLAFYGFVIGFAMGLSYLGIFYMAGVVFLGTILDELPKAFPKPAERVSSGPTHADPWADTNAATPQQVD